MKFLLVLAVNVVLIEVSAVIGRLAPWKPDTPLSTSIATTTPSSSFDIGSLDLDVNAVDVNGSTALHYAVIGSQDEPEEVAALLKRGANIEARDHWGQTPLIFAVHYNLTRSIQVLLDRGANVNAESFEGWTALDIAASNGDANMAKILLEKGADPTIRYRIPNDTIPADNDASEPQPPPRTRTALSLAAVNGPAELVRMLLAHGANASAQDGDGVSALHEAIAARNLDSMRALLAAGANPRAKFRSTTGTGRADITPLLLATKLNTTEMAKLLLGVTDGGGEEVKVTEKVDVGNTGEEKTTSKPTIASEGFQT